MTSPSYDIAIVGGGIVGTACAAEATANGLSVAIIEVDVIGSGATAAGMGHLLLMDDSEATLNLTRYSLELWENLIEHLPANAQYTRSGTIWVALDDDEMAAIEDKSKTYRALGVAHTVLASGQMYDLEPHLCAGLAGGLLLPGDGIVYAPVVAQYLFEQARARGAVRFLGQAVTHIEDGSLRLADGRAISAKMIINAAGHRAGNLLEGIHVSGRKGHLLITDRYPGMVKHQLVEMGYIKKAHASTQDSVSFNVQPRPTGQLLIGSSRQFDAPEQSVDEIILGQMLERAYFYMPVLRELSIVRIWTGMRATTPDKLPIIGRHPKFETVYVATGHEGLGITTSLATAKLLFDQILSRPSQIPIHPYLPDRIAAWSA